MARRRFYIFTRDNEPAIKEEEMKHSRTLDGARVHAHTHVRLHANESE